MQEFWNIYVHTLTKNYANFSGRARRKEYWGFFLINFIVSGVLGLIEGVLFGTTSSENVRYPMLSGLYSLAVLVPTLALAARRLHDTGRSGWMQLLAFIPIIGSLILLYFYVQDSQPQANKWGPNPKAPLGMGSAVSPARADW